MDAKVQEHVRFHDDPDNAQERVHRDAPLVRPVEPREKGACRSPCRSCHDPAGNEPFRALQQLREETQRPGASLWARALWLTR